MVWELSSRAYGYKANFGSSGNPLLLSLWISYAQTRIRADFYGIPNWEL